MYNIYTIHKPVNEPSIKSRRQISRTHEGLAELARAISIEQRSRYPARQFARCLRYRWPIRKAVDSYCHP